MRLRSPSLLLAALLGLSQCKNTAPAPAPVRQVELLPPPTETGRRTFGFLLNGKAWYVDPNPFNGPRFTADYTYKRLRLYASGGIDSTNVAGLRVGGIVGFDIRNILAAGTYTIDGRDSSSVGYVSYNDGPAKCTYQTDSTHPATVTVTKLDFNARIVSGTFSFTLETPGCKKVVVTQGRFDSLF
jgi:hypothetical protein